MKTTRRMLALSVGIALLAGSAAANDRDLLYEKRAAPPNILILVANTESMATCEPYDPNSPETMPNGQTCTGLTTGLGASLAPFGIGDSVYSKMGKAKSAIQTIIEANPTSYYFGLTSESYTRQTARTGTTKRYTFVAKEASFCDGSSGGLYWACQPAGTALNFGPALLSSGSVTTLSSGGVTYQVIPIGGLPAGGATYDYTANVGNETWIQSFGGDTNHQPYLVNSSSVGMILTNPTGALPAANGTAANQEVVITYSSTTSSTGDPYRIHQCSTDCTFTDSGFDGQKFTVTKKIVQCPSSTGAVTSVSVTKQGSGYTSVPTVSISGGGGSGATATASLGVVSYTVTAAGSNYTSTPTCTVSAPPAGGTTATCTVTISGKKVNKVNVATNGSGYTSVPTVTITGGGGSGGKATATLGVVSIAVTNGGVNYTSTPSVSITGGGGSGATPTAVVTGTTGSYPCAPTATGAITESTQTIDYVVPPLPGTNTTISNLLTYCSEDSSTCSYPMVYSTSDSSTGGAKGEEMGWIYYGDTDVSGNQSGWITNPANNPQPVVMIPHPYTPWASYPGPLQYPSGTSFSGGSVSFQYTQSSIPCIQRSFRPLSAIIDNTSSHTQKDNYPIFGPTTSTTDGSGNLSSSQCDSMVDGLWQTQFFKNNGGTATNEIAPVIFPAGHNGSGIDLVKMLTNTYQYYNGGNNGCTTAGSYVDGFCGGARPDDPFQSCRLSAVILITDSFTGSSPDFKFGQSGDPTTQLKSINVPVFVIGYAMAPNSAGTCSLASLPDGTTGLNYGQCIAYYSGATTFQGTDVTRQGYYSVGTASDLGTALQAVLNSLSTVTRDFATATIPSVSATSAGIAYLSQFNPKNNRSIWEGHLRAYFLDPSTGLVKADPSTGKPDPTVFSFWTGTTGATGSLLWDAGGTGSDTPGVTGHLDGLRSVDPTLLLTAQPGPGGVWSDDTAGHTAGHDQALYPAGGVGRNVFFGLKPGATGCASTTYECLTQIPVGTGGSAPTPSAITSGGDYVGAETAAGGKWTVASPPSSLPTWWSTVQGSTYMNIPTTPLEGAGNQSQALQNTFSFLRGNRDPVVEAFKVAAKFDSTHTTCASLSTDSDSPCYYGDVMGDLFHSNPSITSAPGNFRYYFAQDPSTSTPGTYADRGKGYQTFYSDHAHRRKILYVGGDDGALHAFDVGVYNGDQSTFGSPAVCPLCNKYSFGSGREIFAYVPRAGLNKAYDLAHTVTYNWTIDGPPSIDDAYIDVTRVGGTVQGVAPSGSTTDSDLSGASPASSAHGWRTVLVGTEREGGLTSDGGGITSGVSGNGGSVFALDITDPDQTNHMKSSDTGGHTGVPECIISDFIPGTTSTPTNCTAPYPRILWEIRDDQSALDSFAYRTELSTSTDATTQDLGMTWSQPVIGRVKITVGATARDFFVAIFGGGYDHTGTTLAATNASGNTGNFLYMVDIETGKVIYKKNLGIWSAGASGTSTAGNLTAGVPGSPAVIDINNDGYLDYLYIGDTQGRLWKVNLTASATLDSTTKRVQTSDWNPTMFFDEYLNAAAQGTNPRQPIFDRPAAFFAGNTSSGTPKIGIAFGTGDRDNMPVLTDTNANKFIIVVDPPGRVQAVDNDHPLTLADLTLASLSTNNCTSSSCLNMNGYYLNLATGASGAQIVNTDPLVFNQQIFFNTFLHTTIAGNCNETGVPFIYIIDYATGVGTATQGPTGTEVLSTDIIYSAGGGANATATGTTDTGAKVNVTASGDSTIQQQVKTGLTPTVKIKSWKEE